MKRTTLPALAATSRSFERADKVALTEASRAEESNAMSRRHSVARALIIARVMRSELVSVESVHWLSPEMKADVRSGTNIASLRLPTIQPHPLL